MTKHLLSAVEKLTPQELAEVELFVSYLLARRKRKHPGMLNDKGTRRKSTKPVKNRRRFNSLSSPTDDVYSASNGVPVRW